MTKERLINCLIALILFIAATYCALWAFSSGSLALVYCDNEFSLFHEEFRCRQPYIASIGVLLLLPSSIFFLWKAIKSRKDK